MKATLEQLAGSPEFAQVEALLDANERERVVALGGLHILGTERHEARRIDNQLRGRAGRQGDPGSSRFYLSLQDDLMRIFGSERISGLMKRLGMEEGIPIEHGMVTRSIERAQSQVEAQNFGMRKHLLEYDDVMNKQRKAVYDMRRMVLEGKDTREHVLRLDRRGRRVVRRQLLLRRTQARPTGTSRACRGRSRRPSAWKRRSPSSRGMPREQMVPKLADAITRRYAEREGAIGAERMLFHQRMLMLQIVDTQWKDHLYSLDHLKEGIGLRGYGQRDPLVEYKKESFQMFQDLMDRIDEEILRWSFLYQPVATPEPAPRAGAPEAPALRGRAALPRARARARARARRRQDRAAQPVLQRPERGPVGVRPEGAAARGRGRHRRGADGQARGAEGRPQRPLPLRQRQEVQEVPRELDA